LAYNVKYEDLGLKDYKEAWDYQTMVFDQIVKNKRNLSDDGAPPAGTLIFVEHPHVYTLGKSGSENNLLLNHIQLRAKDAQFYKTDRGGDITYHGPGQLVGYPLFDLEALNCGLKEYVHKIEEAIIVSLKHFGLNAGRLTGATGVWLDQDMPQRARKICAIGVRASRHVTMHGFALNVNTALEYFEYINPCGFTDKGVTSISRETGGSINMDEVKTIVKQSIKSVFQLELI